MAVPDASGNVTLTVLFFADPILDAYDSSGVYQASGSSTLGALADSVAADQGFTAGGVSVMGLPRPGHLPVIESRATLLSNSVITNGSRVIVIPGS